MDNSIKIMIIAKPGHYRDSLVALLMAIRSVQLSVVNNSLAGIPKLIAKRNPHVLLVDLEGSRKSLVEEIMAVKERSQHIKWALLVGDIRQVEAAKTLGPDCVLTKSTPARDFQSTVKNLVSGEATKTSGMFHHLVSTIGGYDTPAANP